MRRRLLFVGYLSLLVPFFLSIGILDAYDLVTHRAIAERAVDRSMLDGYLRTELGLHGGKDELFLGRSLRDWVGEGSVFEDSLFPFPRVFRHFHNPLYHADGNGLGPWSQAGLFGLFQSSVQWGQNPSQDPFPFGLGGGNWSWQDARRHYLNALTRPRKEDQGNQPGRDTAFAETFEALGRLTHLIQDASVPAHVRNDPHPRLLRNPDWYEEWKS